MIVTFSSDARTTTEEMNVITSTNSGIPVRDIAVVAKVDEAAVMRVVHALEGCGFPITLRAPDPTHNDKGGER